MKNISKLLLVACFAMNVSYVQSSASIVTYSGPMISTPTTPIDYLTISNQASVPVIIIYSLDQLSYSTVSVPLQRTVNALMRNGHSLQVVAVSPFTKYANSLPITIQTTSDNIANVAKTFTVTTQGKRLVVSVS